MNMGLLGIGMRELFPAGGDLDQLRAHDSFHGPAAHSDGCVNTLSADPNLRRYGVSAIKPIRGGSWSCGGSSGLPPQRHGLFTYYLLKGLGGAAFVDGKLTLGALQAYLAREVPGQARKMGRRQTP